MIWWIAWLALGVALAWRHHRRGDNEAARVAWGVVVLILAMQAPVGLLGKVALHVGAAWAIWAVAPAHWRAPAVLILASGALYFIEGRAGSALSDAAGVAAMLSTLGNPHGNACRGPLVGRHDRARARDFA